MGKLKKKWGLTFAAGSVTLLKYCVYNNQAEYPLSPCGTGLQVFIKRRIFIKKRIKTIKMERSAGVYLRFHVFLQDGIIKETYVKWMVMLSAFFMHSPVQRNMPPRRRTGRAASRGKAFPLLDCTGPHMKDCCFTACGGNFLFDFVLRGGYGH